MKKIFLTLFLSGIFCEFSFSQTVPKFVLTKYGIKPVVMTFDANYNAGKIYTKLKNWNASQIKYPQSAIRIDKEDTQLKFAGYIEEGWKVRANNFDHWYSVQYTLNVEIKDGKCRITIDTPEVNYKVWYAADGSLLKKFIDSKTTFETSINKLLASLYTHIKDAPKKVEDNW